MKLRRVDPNTIKVPEVRVTAQFDPELEEQFEASVKETGIEEPIICYLVGEDLVLSDGLHRLQQAIARGDEKVDVVVRDGDMIKVLTRNLMSGHLRGKHPVSEMVKVIAVLWKEYDLDSEKIAKETGMTRDYVEKLQKLSTLTPLARLALDQGRIGVGHAEALTLIQDPIRQEMALGQLELYKWTVPEFREHCKEITRIVQEAEEPPAETPERLPTQIRCFYCGGEFDVARIANPNTCQECAGALLASIAQARAELAKETESREEPGGE